MATPRWTDDNLLQYSLNAQVNSAVFVGRRSPRRRPRTDRRIGSRSPSMRRMPTPVAAQRRAAGALSADGKWRAQARETAASTGRRSDAAPTSRSGTRRASRAAPSTGCASSRTARTIRRPIRALRPAAEITITARRRRRSRRRSRRSACAPRMWRGIRTASTIAFTADENWQNEQALREPDIYTVTTRRQGDAADQRRLRLELAGVFARRAVPARPSARSAPA